MYKYIAVSGTIGAGKTELATKIAQRENAILILEEFAHNSFLEKFYSDAKRYAFPLEISFLFERFQQLTVEFSKAELFRNKFVSDYFFDKSYLFARINLLPDQFNVFKSLYLPFRDQIPQPDLLLYLHRPVEALLDNIRKRGRAFEQGISIDYLEALQESYLSYLKSLENMAVLVLKLGTLDFLNDTDILNGIIDLTQQNHKFGVTNIRF